MHEGPFFGYFCLLELLEELKEDIATFEKGIAEGGRSNWNNSFEDLGDDGFGCDLEAELIKDVAGYEFVDVRLSGAVLHFVLFLIEYR